jgi:hypothetical protein
MVTLLDPVSKIPLWPSENGEPYERLIAQKSVGGLDAAEAAITKRNVSLPAGSAVRNAFEQPLR